MNREQFERIVCTAGSLRLAAERFAAPWAGRGRCLRLPDASPPADAFAWFELLARAASAGCVALSDDQCARYAVPIFVAAAAAAAVDRPPPRFRGDSPSGDARLRAVALAVGMELEALAGRPPAALGRALTADERPAKRSRAAAPAPAPPADPLAGAMRDAHREASAALRAAEAAVDAYGRGARDTAAEAVLDAALGGCVGRADAALALMARRWASARTVRMRTAAEWDAARLERGRAERAAARLYALRSAVRAALVRAVPAASDAVDVAAVYELLLDARRRFPVLEDRADAARRWHARGPGALLLHLRAQQDDWRITPKADAGALTDADPIWFGSTVRPYSWVRDYAAQTTVYFQSDRFGRNPGADDLFPARGESPLSTASWTPERFKARADVAVAGPVVIGFDHSAASSDFVMLPHEECASVTAVTIPRIDLGDGGHDRARFLYAGTVRLQAGKLKRHMKRIAKLVLYAFAQQGVDCPVLCPFGCEGWDGRTADVPRLWAEAVADCLAEGADGHRFRMVVISLADEHGIPEGARGENEGAITRTFDAFRALPVVVALWPGAVTIARVLKLRGFETGILNPCGAATVLGGHVGARWEGAGRTASEDALGTQTTLVLHHRTLNPALYADPARWLPFPPRV